MTDTNTQSTQSEYQWADIINDGSLAEFAEKRGVLSDHLQTQSDALILPINYFNTKESVTQILFPKATKDVLSMLGQAGLKSELYDDSRDRRELVLKFADIVLPIVVFVGTYAAAIGTNILSNYIYDRWVKQKTEPEPIIKSEYAQIEKDGTVVRWRRLEAPASKASELLEQESNSFGSSVRSSSIAQDKGINQETADQYQSRQATVAFEVAKGLITEAEQFLAKDQLDVAEQLFRSSLSKIREAFLWQRQSTYRQFLHEVGLRIHNAFGCKLELSDGSYWVTCPVLLSHSRGGFSIGGAATTICSICGQELLTCPHEKGQKYDRVIANRNHGVCNICGEERCDHQEGEPYDGVELFGIVTNIELDHISIVDNPANPLAVFQRYSLTKKDIEEMLPKDERDQFIYGQTEIHCHHCEICDGKL